MERLSAPEILDLYDREMRREVRFPGCRREALPEVVRHVGLLDLPDMNFVLYSRLDESNADAVIGEQVAYFESIGHNFEWKVYDHDRPADLRARLAARGFDCEEPEAILALDLRAAPASLLRPIAADVRRITDAEALEDVVSTQAEVWRADFGWLRERLTRELRERPEYTSVYVAYADGVPASSAWINFYEASRFAGLWGGSTLERYRRRGLYAALLAVRAQEAIARGYRFLTIDASPMSRPIAEKHGFRLLTYAHACNWRSRQNAPASPAPTPNKT